jgi:hypothetical protein
VVSKDRFEEGSLSYGFAPVSDERGNGRRLTISVPSSLLYAARQRNPGFAEKVQGLVSTKHLVPRIDRIGTVLFSVNAAAIGKIRNPGFKKVQLDRVNSLIAQLVKVEPSPVDGPLQLLSFGAAGTHSKISARLRLPPLKSALLSEIALNRMRIITREMNVIVADYPNRSVNSLAVKIDGEAGINLRHRDIRFRSQPALPTEESLVVSGTTHYVEQPLVFLAGMVALAHADTLVDT